MKIYSQNDPRWQHTKIGFDTGAIDTIGNYGCYMTSIANVCVWAGHDITPLEVNNLCKKHDGWLVSSDLVAKPNIPALLCHNLEFVEKRNWNDATSMNYFDDASDPDIAYIICIDAGKAPGIQTHFVMVWAKLGHSDLEINDSWDGVRKPLSHYGNPSVIIQSATKFRKIKKATPATVPIHKPKPKPVVVPVVEPAPKPYVPPAAPVEAKKVDKYTLLTILPYFGSVKDLQSDRNALGTLDEGDYIVWEKQDIFYNLTTDNQKNQNKWVNSLLNKATPVKVEPLPAPATITLEAKPAEKTVETTADIMASYRWFYPTREAVEYKILKDYIVRDQVHTSKPITIHAGSTVEIYGTFQKGGITYLRPLTGLDERGLYAMYGIPTTDIYTGVPFLNNEFNVGDKVLYGVDLFIDKAVKTLEGIFRWRKKK